MENKPSLRDRLKKIGTELNGIKEIAVDEFNKAKESETVQKSTQWASETIQNTKSEVVEKVSEVKARLDKKDEDETVDVASAGSFDDSPAKSVAPEKDAAKKAEENINKFEANEKIKQASKLIEEAKELLSK